MQTTSFVHLASLAVKNRKVEIIKLISDSRFVSSSLDIKKEYIFVKISKKYCVFIQYSAWIISSDCFQPNVMSTSQNGGKRWRNWLTHCATCMKVAASIPDWNLKLFIDITLPTAL